jgi:hypothetical protein
LADPFSLTIFPVNYALRFGRMVWGVVPPAGARDSGRTEPANPAPSPISGVDSNLLLLGESRLVFNPPVWKENLQSGKGFLSRRFFSFDELLEACGR